jgi:glycosyltransferase involved in cell wall biosynthesis
MRVVHAFGASSAPMGQQLYESELRAALTRARSDLEITEVSISGWRGTGRRVPARLHWNLPYRMAATFGKVTYPRADLVHRMDLRLPPVPDEVLTIHDLPPLRFDDEGSLPRHAYASAQRAAAVFVPSRFAAAEVRELLGVEKVIVAYNGAPGVDRLPVERPSEVPFVVHTGGATKRKNLRSLAEAWRAVKRRDPMLPHRLVLAGPPHPARVELFRGLPDVELRGLLPHSRALALIATAAVVVIPSLYEGFGLPALEAMSLGRVVVAADRGALPEVCGEAALLCEPDGESLCAALERAIHDAPLRSALHARGPKQAALFTWDGAAATVLSEYDRLLN